MNFFWHVALVEWQLSSSSATVDPVSAVLVLHVALPRSGTIEIVLREPLHDATSAG